MVAAHTLDQGSAYVQDALGVPMAGGGKHAAVGTHNRVLKLGPGQYLEVIAIDPEGRQPEFPRWFNLDDPEFQDRLKTRPRLITWVVRTENVDVTGRSDLWAAGVRSAHAAGCTAMAFCLHRRRIHAG